MKILLDHCVPRPFENLLQGHDVKHTSRLGWGGLSNGNLLAAAEDGGFDVLITVDSGIRYQQSLAGRSLSLLVLRCAKSDIPTLSGMIGTVLEALAALQPGTVTVIEQTGTQP